MVISDIVAVAELPRAVRDSPELWAECISGAVSEKEIREHVEKAGLTNFQVLDAREWVENGKALPLKSMTFRATRPLQPIRGRS